jgi:hypothetical protein
MPSRLSGANCLKKAKGMKPKLEKYEIWAFCSRGNWYEKNTQRFAAIRHQLTKGNLRVGLSSLKGRKNMRRLPLN